MNNFYHMIKTQPKHSCIFDTMKKINAVVAMVAACTAALTTLAAACVVLNILCEEEMDGRSYCNATVHCYSIHSSQFKLADANDIYNNGWFCETLRCTKIFIVEQVTNAWPAVHNNVPNYNAQFTIRECVGACLHYLTHTDSMADTRKIFGMSKSTTYRAVEEVTDVLIKSIGLTVIKLPSSYDDWLTCQKEFEAMCGFPNACLAIDSTLIRIQRTQQYEGWYCHKGYPAIKLQLVVDGQQQVHSYCMRPGSENNSGVYS